MPLKLQPPRPGKSPYFYIRGTIRGRSVNASTKTANKKAAERFKEQFELSIAKQEAEGSTAATFRVAAEMYSGFRKPPKRDQAWIDRLVAVMGNIALSDMRQHILVRAANELYPRGKPETKNRQVLGVAAAILHYAAENRLCGHIRVSKFKEKTPEARALSREQAEVLMGSAEGQMKLLLTWLFCQGWRVSDVLRVRWEDIDLGQETVLYHISKTDDRRKMPLHPRVMALLKRCAADIGKVFHWSDKSNLYRDLKPLCAKLKIHFTPHMARHSFATWLANEGVSPLELMEAGGWKDHKSVMRYAKLDPTRVRTIIGKI